MRHIKLHGIVLRNRTKIFANFQTDHFATTPQLQRLTFRTREGKEFPTRVARLNTSCSVGHSLQIVYFGVRCLSIIYGHLRANLLLPFLTWKLAGNAAAVNKLAVLFEQTVAIRSLTLTSTNCWNISDTNCGAILKSMASGAKKHDKRRGKEIEEWYDNYDNDNFLMTRILNQPRLIAKVGAATGGGLCPDWHRFWRCVYWGHTFGDLEKMFCWPDFKSFQQ